MSQSYWCFFRKVQSGVCAFWNSCKPTQWVKHLPTDPLRSNFPFVRTPRQMGKRHECCRLLLLDFQRSCWKHVGTVWNRKSSDSHIVVRSWMPRILSGIAFIAKSLSSNSGVMRDRDGLFTHYQRYFVYITFAIRANLPYLKSFSNNHHLAGTPQTPISYGYCNSVSPNDILRPPMTANRYWRPRWGGAPSLERLRSINSRRLKKHTHFHFLLGLPHKDLLSLLGSTNPCGSTLFKWNLFYCWEKSSNLTFRAYFSRCFSFNHQPVTLGSQTFIF